MGTRPKFGRIRTPSLPSLAAEMKRPLRYKITLLKVYSVSKRLIHHDRPYLIVTASDLTILSSGVTNNVFCRS